MIYDLERRYGRYHIKLDYSFPTPPPDQVHQMFERLGLIRSDNHVKISPSSSTEIVVEICTKSGRCLTQKEICELELDISREKTSKRAWRSRY